MKKVFEIDHKVFQVDIDKSGQITFEPVVKPNYDKNDLFWDDGKHDDFGTLKNAMPVFKKVIDIVIDHIYTKKPVHVYFSASTDRKKKIYGWFVKKIEMRLKKDYFLSEYPDGVYNFYKREK